MSLLYGDNFEGQTSFPEYSGSIFYGGIDRFRFLFEGEDWEIFHNESYLISAENLILPATALTDECYQYMFYNCYLLTTAPALPATVMDDYCYSNMFAGCTSLSTAPALPATTLTQGCLPLSVIYFLLSSSLST